MARNRQRMTSFVLLMLTIQGSWSLALDKSLEEIRASLITKHNIQEHRDKKGLESAGVPASFVVTTELKVNSQQDEQRRGRSYPDGNGNTIVEGVRLPDDRTDQMIYRNGRFINNVFVPLDASVPKETVISSDGDKAPRTGRMISNFEVEGRGFNPGFNEYYLGGGRPAARDSLALESKTFEQAVAAPRSGKADIIKPKDYSFHAGNTQKGRPVYYVVEEPDSLHSDRSPYTYEPADSENSFPDAGIQFSHSGIAQASQSDFVIKEHTYTMCPGCPTFSIPVPIPVASLRQEQQEKQQLQHNFSEKDLQTSNPKEKSFLERIGGKIASTMKGIQNRIFDGSKSFLGTLDDDKTLSEKKADSSEGSKTSYLPMMVAGAAAVALGGIAMFGTGPGVTTIGARNLRDEKNSQILQTIESAKEIYGN